MEFTSNGQSWSRNWTNGGVVEGRRLKRSRVGEEGSPRYRKRPGCPIARSVVALQRFNPVRFCPKDISVQRVAVENRWSITSLILSRQLSRWSNQLSGMIRNQRSGGHARVSRILSANFARKVTTSDKPRFVKFSSLGKKENVGCELRPKGTPIEVDTHDFPDPELGKAVPYGVYDIGKNNAFVSIGVSKDTAEFAVEAIRRWWNEIGYDSTVHKIASW